MYPCFNRKAYIDRNRKVYIDPRCTASAIDLGCTLCRNPTALVPNRIQEAYRTPAIAYWAGGVYTSICLYAETVGFKPITESSADTKQLECHPISSPYTIYLKERLHTNNCWIQVSIWLPVQLARACSSCICACMSYVLSVPYWYPRSYPSLYRYVLEYHSIYNSL